MGNCTGISGPADDHSVEVARELRRAELEDRNVVKLLLLGAGESGKSTIFKQLKELHGTGFGDTDRSQFTSVVYHNAMTSMKTLIEEAENLDIQLEPEIRSIATAFLEMGDQTVIDEEVGGIIKRLWASPAIRRVFAQKSKFQLNDSAECFFDKMDEIMAPNYVPTFNDVLRARVRTSGIVELSLVIDGVAFQVYDVGGQRNERKKWIHCFEWVTAVIFVAAISEYDQVLYEDTTENRVDEALQLFAQIANSRWFTRSNIILFLNKRDLFERKLRMLPLDAGGCKAFADYNHGTCTCTSESYDCSCGVQHAAKMFVQEKFISLQVPRPPPDPHFGGCQAGGQLYSHFTCATDTNNIRLVFQAATDIILRSNLVSAGFM